MGYLKVLFKYEWELVKSRPVRTSGWLKMLTKMIWWKMRTIA